MELEGVWKLLSDAQLGPDLEWAPGKSVMRACYFAFTSVFLLTNMYILIITFEDSMDFANLSEILPFI